MQAGPPPRHRGGEPRAPGLYSPTGSCGTPLVSAAWPGASAGPPLAEPCCVEAGVMATAQELFEARHYPSVVALISDALEDHPEHVPALLLRARAHIALRRDLEAQADLRDIIRLDPQCALAYRLLGELAARRDEHDSAAIFFREALRLDPDDREASEWLAIVEISARPAAAAYKLPAPAAAAGRFPPARGPIGRAQTATDGAVRSIGSPARSERPGSHARFAHG
ncbi:MAG: tetratricopeptide repeat protein, partial [Acidobacteriota bacterium]